MNLRRTVRACTHVCVCDNVEIKFEWQWRLKKNEKDNSQKFYSPHAQRATNFDDTIDFGIIFERLYLVIHNCCCCCCWRDTLLLLLLDDNNDDDDDDNSSVNPSRILSFEDFDARGTRVRPGRRCATVRRAPSRSPFYGPPSTLFSLLLSTLARRLWLLVYYSQRTMNILRPVQIQTTTNPLFILLSIRHDSLSLSLYVRFRNAHAIFLFFFFFKK